MRNNIECEMCELCELEIQGMEYSDDDDHLSLINYLTSYNQLISNPTTLPFTQLISIT